LALSTTKTMSKNQAYLEPNRNSMHIPIEGLSAQPLQPIYSINKGAIEKNHNSTHSSENDRNLPTGYLHYASCRRHNRFKPTPNSFTAKG
jgi:hypothetical protein